MIDFERAMNVEGTPLFFSAPRADRVRNKARGRACA